MTPFQNRLWTTAGLAVLAATLTGCGKNDEAQSAGAAAVPAKVAADVKAAATKTSAAAQGDSNKTADGNTLRLQGTMQVDAGQGAVPMRSMATVIDA
ncbi:MAG: hypothetical protein KKB08_12555, partial [Gammaproteobacteria bacterium]|nr:hypothetical protein [Gammaproteobacteria bacterium]